MRRSIFTIAAIVLIAGFAPVVAAQTIPSHGNTPLPEGRRLEARDGDLVVADQSARVRFLRRRNAIVRLIFNPTDRWAVMLADFVPPGGSADGYVDYTYNWRQIQGNWPLGDRWEGAVVIEEYLSPGFGPGGLGLVLPEGRLQFLNNAPPQDGGFVDPQALAVLSYRGGGGGGGPSRETFDQHEPRAIAGVVANAGNASFSTFSAPGGVSGSVGFSSVTAGVVGVPGSVTRSSSEPNAPIRVGGSIQSPRKTHDVAPVYPESMRQSGVGGVIILELVIGADGSVTSAKVLRGQWPEIDRAAIEAAKQWRYEPTLLNGAPVPIILTATVNVQPREQP